MKKTWLMLFGFILLICLFVYSTLGIFVVQPIGAIPEGVSIVYWRGGTKLPFVSSADGLSLKTTGNVTLLGRIVLLGEISKLIQEKIVARLPYSEWLYLMSTGGVKFTN